jgi:nucleoside-diphosphate-sugar epimerase
VSDLVADGTCIRDYIHVTDLVDAHVTVTAHLRNPPALYNVGTGRGYSVKQFVDTCRKVSLPAPQDVGGGVCRVSPVSRIIGYFAFIAMLFYLT